MKMLFAAAAIVSLSGCALGPKISDSICTHQLTATIAADQAMASAHLIKDATARALAIQAAQTLLDLVAACPPIAHVQQAQSEPSGAVLPPVQAE